MKKQNIAVTAITVAALAGGAIVAVPAFASGDTGSSSSAPSTGSGSRVSPHKASLDKLVADGTITQAQADAVQAQLEADRPTRGDGRGHGGMGGRSGGETMSAAASALGLTADELRTQLQTRSLGQIADDAGVSRDSLISAMEKAATAELGERLGDMLDRVPGERGERLRGGGLDEGDGGGSQAPSSGGSSTTAS